MEFLHEWIVPAESGVEAWVYIATALAALVITAVAKGGFGGGVGVVSVPLMLQVAPVKFVLGLWLPVLIICDLATIHQDPRETERVKRERRSANLALELEGRPKRGKARITRCLDLSDRRDLTGIHDPVFNVARDEGDLVGEQRGVRQKRERDRSQGGKGGDLRGVDVP